MSGLLSAPLARRAGWGLADQAVSSGSNFLYALVVAREVDAGAFGAFGTGFAVYVLLTGGVRTFTSEALAVGFSDRPAPEQRVAIRRSSGAAAVAGAAIGAIVAGVAVVLGGDLGAALIPVGLLAPALVLQDAARFSFAVQGRPDRAFWNDLVWLGGLALVTVGLLASGSAGLPTLAWAWAGTGALAGAVALLQGLPVPSLRAWRGWLTDQRGVGGRYGAEFAATAGAWQSVLFGSGAIAGLTSVAALRGVQVLFGPLHVVNRAALLILVPEGIRATGRGPAQVQRLARITAACLALLATAWTLAILAIPADVGREILGDSWRLVDPVRLPFGAFMAALGGVAGCAVALRVLGDPGASLRAALQAAPCQIACGLLGAAISGATGAAGGLLIGGALSHAIWWRAVVRATNPVPTPMILEVP